MSALAEALKAAGIGNAPESLAEITARIVLMSREECLTHVFLEKNDDATERRLMQMAKTAIRQNPRNWDGAKDALYAAVRHDPDLLWEMFKGYRVQAAHLLLTEAAALVREEDRPKVAAERSDAGHSGRDSLESPARVTPPKPSAKDGMSAVSKVVTLTLLDTFKINGQPIGELTPVEANNWAGSRERDARFVRLLTQNLPPDQPIKKFRSGDDAAALMALALKAGA